jgi:hypothetical protein
VLRGALSMTGVLHGGDGDRHGKKTAHAGLRRCGMLIVGSGDAQERDGVEVRRNWVVVDR